MQLETIYVDVKLRGDKEVKKSLKTLSKLSKQIKSGKLKVKVDDSELTALNKHLDLKLKHLSQVNDYFAKHPITVAVDYSNLRKLSTELDKLPSEKSVSVKVNEVKKSNSGNISQRSSSTTLRPDTQTLKYYNNSTKHLQMIESLSAELLKEIIRQDTPINTIITSFFSSIGSYGFDVSKRVAYNSLSDEINFQKIEDDLTEGVRSGITAIKPLIKNLKEAGGEVLKFGKLLTYRVGSRISDTYFRNYFQKDYKNSEEGKKNPILKTRYISDTVSKDFKELVDSLKNIVDNADFDFSDLRKFAFEKINEFASDYRSVVYSNITPDLVKLRAEQLVTEGSKKNTANKVTDSTKEVAIVTGGFAVTEGKSGVRLIRELRAIKKNTSRLDLWVANRDTDLESNSDDREAFVKNILKQFTRINLRGYNEDSVEMAAQGYLAKLKNPDVQIKLIGESGGGYAAEEAHRILKEMGITSEYLAVGTPNIIGGANVNDNNVISVDEPLGILAKQALEPFGLAEVPEDILGIKRHPFEGYSSPRLAELQNILKGLEDLPDVPEEALKYSYDEKLNRYRDRDSGKFVKLNDDVIERLKEFHNTIADITEAAKDHLEYIEDEFSAFNLDAPRNVIDNQINWGDAVEQSPEQLAEREEKFEEVLEAIVDLQEIRRLLALDLDDFSKQKLNEGKKAYEKVLRLLRPTLDEDADEIGFIGSLESDYKKLRPYKEFADAFTQDSDNLELRKEAVKYANDVKELIRELGNIPSFGSYGEEIKDLIQFYKKILKQLYSKLDLQLMNEVDLDSAKENEYYGNEKPKEQTRTYKSKAPIVKDNIHEINEKLDEIRRCTCSDDESNINLEKIQEYNASQEDLLSELINVVSNIVDVIKSSQTQSTIVDPWEDSSNVTPDPWDVGNKYPTIPDFWELEPETSSVESIKNKISQVRDILKKYNLSIRVDVLLEEAYKNTIRNVIDDLQNEIHDALTSLSPAERLGTPEGNKLSQLSGEHAKILKEVDKLEEEKSEESVNLLEYSKKIKKLYHKQLNLAKELLKTDPIKAKELLKGILDTVSETRDVLDSLSNSYPKSSPERRKLGSVKGGLKQIENESNKVINSAKLQGIQINLGYASGLKASTNKLKNAVSTNAKTIIATSKDVLGVKSPSTVFRDIGKALVDGFEVGIEGFNNSTKKISEYLTKASKKISPELYKTFKNIGKDLKTDLVDLVGSGLIAIGSYFSIQALMEFNDIAVEAAKVQLNFQNTLKFVSGTFEEYRKNVDHLNHVVNTYSVNLLSAEEGFKSITAATKKTKSEGDITRDVFEGMSAALLVLGANADESSRAFLALQQIASKGLQAEELLQLAESVPGLSQVAARGFGYQDFGEFKKFVEKQNRSGQGITGQEFLPRFSKQLMAEFKTASLEYKDSLQSVQNEFENIKLQISRKFGAIGAELLRGDLILINSTLKFIMNNLVTISSLLGAVLVNRILALRLYLIPLLDLLKVVKDVVKDIVKDVAKKLGIEYFAKFGVQVAALTYAFQTLFSVINEGFVRDSIGLKEFIKNSKVFFKSLQDEISKTSDGIKKVYNDLDIMNYDKPNFVEKNVLGGKRNKDIEKQDKRNPFSKFWDATFGGFYKNVTALSATLNLESTLEKYQDVLDKEIKYATVSDEMFTKRMRLNKELEDPYLSTPNRAKLTKEQGELQEYIESRKARVVKQINNLKSAEKEVDNLWKENKITGKFADYTKSQLKERLKELEELNRKFEEYNTKINSHILLQAKQFRDTDNALNDGLAKLEINNTNRDINFNRKEISGEVSTGYAEGRNSTINIINLQQELNLLKESLSNFRKYVDTPIAKDLYFKKGFNPNTVGVDYLERMLEDTEDAQEKLIYERLIKIKELEAKVSETTLNITEESLSIQNELKSLTEEAETLNETIEDLIKSDAEFIKNYNDGIKNFNKQQKESINNIKDKWKEFNKNLKKESLSLERELSELSTTLKNLKLSNSLKSINTSGVEGLGDELIDIFVDIQEILTSQRTDELNVELELLDIQDQKLKLQEEVVDIENQIKEIKEDNLKEEKRLLKEYEEHSKNSIKRWSEIEEESKKIKDKFSGIKDVLKNTGVELNGAGDKLIDAINRITYKLSNRNYKTSEKVKETKTPVNTSDFGYASPSVKQGWDAVIKGSVTAGQSLYGKRFNRRTGRRDRLHNGIDFDSTEGLTSYDMVQNMFPGVVTNARQWGAGYKDRGRRGRSNAVQVKSKLPGGGHFYVDYGHLQQEDIRVKSNSKIKAGQKLGKLSNNDVVSAGGHLDLKIQVPTSFAKKQGFKTGTSGRISGTSYVDVKQFMKWYRRQVDDMRKAAKTTPKASNKVGNTSGLPSLGKGYSSLEGLMKSFSKHSDFNLDSAADRARLALVTAIGGSEVYSKGATRQDFYTRRGGTGNNMLGALQYNLKYHRDKVNTPGKYRNFTADILTGRSNLPNSRASMDYGKALVKAIESGVVKTGSQLEQWMRDNSLGGSNWQGVDDGFGRVPGLTQKLLNWLQEEVKPLKTPKKPEKKPNYKPSTVTLEPVNLNIDTSDAKMKTEELVNKMEKRLELNTKIQEQERIKAEREAVTNLNRYSNKITTEGNSLSSEYKSLSEGTNQLINSTTNIDNTVEDRIRTRANELTKEFKNQREQLQNYIKENENSIKNADVIIARLRQELPNISGKLKERAEATLKVYESEVYKRKELIKLSRQQLTVLNSNEQKAKDIAKAEIIQEVELNGVNKLEESRLNLLQQQIDTLEHLNNGKYSPDLTQKKAELEILRQENATRLKLIDINEQIKSGAITADVGKTLSQQAVQEHNNAVNLIQQKAYSEINKKQEELKKAETSRYEAVDGQLRESQLRLREAKGKLNYDPGIRTAQQELKDLKRQKELEEDINEINEDRNLSDESKQNLINKRIELDNLQKEIDRVEELEAAENRQLEFKNQKQENSLKLKEKELELTEQLNDGRFDPDLELKKAELEILKEGVELRKDLLELEKKLKDGDLDEENYKSLVEDANSKYKATVELINNRTQSNISKKQDELQKAESNRFKAVDHEIRKAQLNLQKTRNKLTFNPDIIEGEYKINNLERQVELENKINEILADRNLSNITKQKLIEKQETLKSLNDEIAAEEKLEALRKGKQEFERARRETLGGSEADLFQTLASQKFISRFDTAAYSAEGAKIRQDLDYLTQQEELEETILKLGIGADEAERLRSNLSLMNEIKLESIRQEANLLGTEIRQGIQSSLQGAIASFAKGETTIMESLQNFAIGVLEMFANLAAEIAAQGIISGIFGGGIGNATSSIVGDSGGGIGNFLGDVISTVVPIASSGMKVGNYSGGGVVAALNKERSTGGGIPVGIVATPGEQVLGKRNGDADFYRALKSRGIWQSLKNGHIPNQYKDVGAGNVTNRTFTVNSPITVISPKPEGYRKTQKQIAVAQERQSRTYFNRFS